MSEDPPAELRARQERAVIESSVSKTRSARVISLSLSLSLIMTNQIMAVNKVLDSSTKNLIPFVL